MGEPYLNKKADEAKSYIKNKYNEKDTKPAIAFMFAILAFFFLPFIGSIVALILAHWSLRQMDSNKSYGFRLAIITLYIAYSQIALLFLVVTLVLVFGILALPNFF